MADPINPVLESVKSQEAISDPYLRELYFGSADYPGLIAQATRAAQQAFLGQPIPVRPTAGLSPLEQVAIQQAYSGIGGFQPYLKAQEQAILGGLGTIGTQRGLSQASLRGFDPRSVGRFYDPFEQQVVQQTIQDVMKTGAQEDIAQRAADIARGGESAFGSRARLGAEERQAALGRGLGEALAQIRSGGYQQALGAAQRESEFGRGALQRAAEFERGVGREMAGYGAELGGLGGTYQQLGQQQRSELMGLGQLPRQLLETRLGREYEAAQEQRYAPLQAMQFVQGFAPQYAPGQTTIQKQYGMPIDPLQYGLSTALGTYASLYQQPQMQQQTPSPTAAPAPSSAPAATTIGGFNPYAPPIPSYQPGQITIPSYTPQAQGIGSILQNPYAPPASSYQPGQINLPLPSALPAGGYMRPGTFGS